MTITTLTIDKIIVDPLNVRTNQEDANSTAALEASILARGLLLPLCVRPLAEPKGKFGAFAGGRRTRAIANLVKRGELPAAWPIPVIIADNLSDKEIIERSTAENYLRRDLRSYEIYHAFAEANAKGASIDELAREFGQRPIWVAQVLRLGNLAPAIFDAFAQGTISEDQAKAYASTEHHDLQMAAFDALKQLHSYQHSPATIRAHLKVGDGEQARRLRFVGADAYRDAGGRYTLDLFAETGDRGLIEDEDILARLVSAKLDTIRKSVATWEGNPVIWTPKPPQNSYGGDDYSLRIHHIDRGPLDGFDEAEVTELQGKLAEVARDHDALCDEENDVLPGNEEQAGKLQLDYEVIERKIAEFEDGRRWKLPQADVVATIKIEEDGRHSITWWYASSKAQRAAARAAGQPRLSDGAATETRGDLGNAKKSADVAAKEEFGLGQDAIDIMRSTRRQMLRAMFVDDSRRGKGGSGVGHDFLIWSLARNLLTSDSQFQIGAVGLASLDAVPINVAPRVSTGNAWEDFEAAKAEIAQQNFMTSQNLAGAFLDFRSASPAVRDLTAAIIGGLALTRSMNADGYRNATHDIAAGQTARSFNGALRRLWQPTAEFLDLLPKAHRLAIAEPLVGKGDLASWGKLKAAELTKQVLRVVKGASVAILPRKKTDAAEWVHPCLQFAEVNVSDDAAQATPEAPSDQHDMEEHLQAEAAE